MSGFSYTAKKDDLAERKFYPMCVDNFFHDPEAIRDFALSLEMTKSDNGAWPGKRTLPLHEIDRDFYNTLMLKVLSGYYDLKHDNVSWESCVAYFQKIDKYESEDENVGWIHKDKTNDDLAGIIYLTPNANPDAGTSLFNLKDTSQNKFVEFATNPDKHAFYNGGHVIKEDYINNLKEHNDLFLESVRFQNIYNRFICYSDEYHRANSFDTGNESRLTLVFFMSGIKQGVTSRYPLSRIKDNYNFDSKLKDRIKYVQTLN